MKSMTNNGMSGAGKGFMNEAYAEFYTEGADPHRGRRREILSVHGEKVRALMGNHPRSALWILGIVIGQFCLAYLLRDQSLWIALPAAYIVGAFFSHALYVFIHESTHNLVFSGTLANRIMGMVCDFPLLIPSAMAFRKYHLMHHVRMGHFESDADIVSPHEARLVGNSSWRKALWMLLAGVSQAMRPTRIREPKLWDRWMVASFCVQAVVIAVVVKTLGWTAVAYLFASSVFGLGLHPLGGRWIAEHYLTHDLEGRSGKLQETYSYYGPLNPVIFNVGYHQEHHDFMTIPWVNLPKLRDVAREHYDSVEHYKSYTALIVSFIFNPKMTLVKRVTRPLAARDQDDRAASAAKIGESEVDRERTESDPSLKRVEAALN